MVTVDTSGYLLKFHHVQGFIRGTCKIFKLPHEGVILDDIITTGNNRNGHIRNLKED